MAKPITTFKGDYSFLSNFYPSPIFYDGLLFPTNEHFYQAMKSNVRSEWVKVASAGTPGFAKKLGRKAPLRPNWEKIKVKVMLYGLRMKFMQEGLEEQLLATGNANLIENNWWHDNFWGNCLCKGCSNIVGTNMAGELLMCVRHEISVAPSSMFWQNT